LKTVCNYAKIKNRSTPSLTCCQVVQSPTNSRQKSRHVTHTTSTQETA